MERFVHFTQSARDELDVERRLERVQCNLTYYPTRQDLIAIAEAAIPALEQLTPLFGRVEVVDQGLYIFKIAFVTFHSMLK